MTSLLRLVDVADEFGLTTAEALALCEQARIPARDGATLLTADDADRFRKVANRPPPPAPSDLPPLAPPPGWVRRG